MARIWSFPRLPISDVTLFIEALQEHGSGERMRRLSLLDVLGIGDSGPTREKIVVSRQYGLTEGGTSAEYIEPTELGLRLVKTQNNTPVLLDIIEAIDEFALFHEKYAGKRVPSTEIMNEWASEIGIPEDRAPKFVEVILRNARDSGLVDELSGNMTFIPFSHAREEAGEPEAALGEQTAPQTAASEIEAEVPSPPAQDPRPSLHIDVQVHIAADAAPEQIDQIFRSMAEHLYQRGDGS